MFVACRGLPTLVGLIDGQDYTANRELILTAIQCIVAVRTYAVCRLPWARKRLQPLPVGAKTSAADRHTLGLTAEA